MTQTTTIPLPDLTSTDAVLLGLQIANFIWFMLNRAPMPKATT